MKKNTQRLLISTGLGMLLGIICIIGQSQRMPSNPLPNSTIYLFNAWYNRVIMGILIGFAGDIVLIKENQFLNSILRGTILGTLVSASFGLFGQEVALLYFFAGIIYGIVIDSLSTWVVNRNRTS